MMRRTLVTALACAALLPAHAAAAAPMKAVIVHLQPRSLSPAAHGARDATRQIEREGRRAQAALLIRLTALRREGHVRHVRPLWIANAVALTADATALRALRARADVSSIEADSALPIEPADAVSGEPGVALTGAPVLWAQGVNGQGITVATLDTGVDLTHPELAGRYRGGGNSWFDPYGQHASPMDVSGHGTEVTGVMVAGGGIGMAPGAKFIATRAFDDAGGNSASGIHAAFQWLLDPDHNPATADAPNVVNISWGARLIPCSFEFQPDLQALRAAHILPVVAAGNDGQGPAPSDNSPANLPEAFAVGAATSPPGIGSVTIAPFSSRGPSMCGGGQFPALVAPGTGIRTTGLAGFDVTGRDGTSFSAPHVAGALALLLQISPLLTASQQASLLTQNAVDLGAPGADSTYGAGLLDIVAAARALHSPALDLDPPVLSGAVDTDTALQVRADDAVSVIGGGEWWSDVDPGVGAGHLLTAADGALDSRGESLVATTAALLPGAHVLGIRARDVFGNWSPATKIPITVPDPAAPPAAAPDAPLVPDVPVVPVLTATPLPTAPELLLSSGLQRVAIDGFEEGLGAWSRRVGLVAATPAAAMSGRRGLRAKLVARAPSFVQRHLPYAGNQVELAFDLNPRTFSSTGAWVEVAAITSASGQRLASVDLRSLRGRHEIRLSSSTGMGAVLHSQRHRMGRRRAVLVLSLDAAEAGLVIDGARVGRLARGAGATAPAAIVLGPWRGGPPGSSGSIDIDRVIVREAPASS
jgi:subtilisin family serine protease